MKNTNSYINNNGNNNDNNKENGGNTTMNNINNNENNNNTTMRNSIRSTRAAEKAEREAKAREAEKKARLDAVKPLGTLDIANLVNSGEMTPWFTPEGELGGMNVGGLYQEPLYHNGEPVMIAAKTPEEVARKIEQIKAGMFGDNAYHAAVMFDGDPIVYYCAGETPELLDDDVRHAEETSIAIRKGIVGTRESAYSLFKGGADLAECQRLGELSDNLKEMVGRDGHKYIIVYDDNYIMSLSGRTKATLDDIKSPLEDADKETILTERLDAALLEEYEDDEDDHEEYDEDEDGENYILGIYDENYELR